MIKIGRTAVATHKRLRRYSRKKQQRLIQMDDSLIIMSAILIVIALAIVVLLFIIIYRCFIASPNRHRRGYRHGSSGVHGSQMELSPNKAKGGSNGNIAASTASVTITSPQRVETGVKATQKGSSMVMKKSGSTRDGPPGNTKPVSAGVDTTAKNYQEQSSTPTDYIPLDVAPLGNIGSVYEQHSSKSSKKGLPSRGIQSPVSPDEDAQIFAQQELSTSSKKSGKSGHTGAENSLVVIKRPAIINRVSNSGADLPLQTGNLNDVAGGGFTYNTDGDFKNDKNSSVITLNGQQIDEGNNTKRTLGMGDTQATAMTQETFIGQGGDLWIIPGFMDCSSTSDYRLSKQLIRGENSIIYQADTFEESLNQRASSIIAKVLHARDFKYSNDNSTWDSLNREISILYRMNSDPFIVKMLAYSSESGAILLYNYPLGNLYQFNGNAKTKKTKRNFLRIIQDVANGIYSLQRVNIVHGCIRPSHVLLYKSSHPPQLYEKMNDTSGGGKERKKDKHHGSVNAVITDLQHCRYISPLQITSTSATGASNSAGIAATKFGDGSKMPKLHQYSPPEAALKQEANYPWDIYGLGHVIHSTLTRYRPMQHAFTTSTPSPSTTFDGNMRGGTQTISPSLTKTGTSGSLHKVAAAALFDRGYSSLGKAQGLQAKPQNQLQQQHEPQQPQLQRQQSQKAQSQQQQQQQQQQQRKK